MLSFGELVDNVSHLIQRRDDSSYEDDIKVWLNLGHETLYEVYDYYNELRETHNFTTTNGTEAYYMPIEFDKPLRLYDITNDKKLTPVQPDEYFDANISNVVDASTGKPAFFRIDGVSAVKRTISSSGTTVQVKSSSGQDTSGIIVRIEGYLDSSKTIIGFENITISTTSPQTYVSGSTTFYGISHISKSADTTGYITVADSSSNTLAEMGQLDRVVYYKVLKLGLIPDASISMRMIYKRRRRKMSNDNDYPFVEADNFLILDALGYALAEQKETFDKAQIIWDRAKEALRLLLSNQQTKSGPEFQHKFESTWLKAHQIR